MVIDHDQLERLDFLLPQRRQERRQAPFLVAGGYDDRNRGGAGTGRIRRTARMAGQPEGGRIAARMIGGSPKAGGSSQIGDPRPAPKPEESP